MLRRIVCLIIVALLAVGLCACGIGGGGGDNGGGNGGDNGGGNGSGDLADARWPGSVYSKYGIDEISTGGKIVYTDFSNESSNHYEVLYKGVTRDELVAWTNGLFEKGFRASDMDKERLTDAGYFYDIMIYCKEEKQPYKLCISFDFDNGMEFEYYQYYDDPNPNFTVVEKEDDYGDVSAFIEYDVDISLSPMKNQEEYEGEFATLGLKAEDLKGVENVRKIYMGEADYMSSIAFYFYSDHVTTEDDVNQCRELLIDKLAANGAKFYDGMDDSNEMTADELKSSGKGSYYVERNGTRFMVMVNPDSSTGYFGDSYGLILTKTN